MSETAASGEVSLPLAVLTDATGAMLSTILRTRRDRRETGGATQ